MPKILGMAADLPSRRVDNEELAPMLGVSASEIERRSGVVARYYAADREGPSDLARRAALRALERAALQPDDVELIVFATMTPDVTFPGAGCYLQEKLGCGTVGALDLRGQCTGFLIALEVARQFVDAGAYRTVLVAGGDVHSSGLDFSPRGAEVTPLFGDGAVVAIVGQSGGGGERTMRSVLHADGTNFERFWCEFPSSRRRPTRFMPEDLSRGKHFPRIETDAVKADGRQQIGRAVEEVLASAKVRREEVTRFFFQHVFPEVSHAAADELGVTSRATIGGRDGGHVASASLAISLCKASQAGETRAGDLVCLATAGAGATSGALLLRM